MNVCQVDGCCRPASAQGDRPLKGTDENTLKYCRKHLVWLRKYGSTDFHRNAQGTLFERFWKFVDKSDGCWLWNGAKQAKGYGLIQDKPEKGARHGKTLLAHRVSFEMHHGSLVDGDYVLHSCDNPSCVNPAHLRRGTQSENIRESYDKGRKKPNKQFGEASGKSKLTIDQVKFIKSHPELGHKAIADMFGLSPNCIRGVRIGRTWKDV